MKSLLAIAAAMTLLIPAMAFAQNNQHNKGGGHPPAAHGAPHAARPGGARPMMRPAHPGGAMAHRPGPGRRPGMAHGMRPGARPGHMAGRPGGNRFSYHGHYYNRVHGRPWSWPHGYGYHRWGIGGILPAIFLSSAYFYGDYATFGLAPPPPGFQWVRYGPDLVLVNLTTGQITNVLYGVFY
ncbi:MAG TPA: RcnB family protein [Stellaceae bacterium]|jgi:Ni/Co efflux regulator RcnB|nr:RcnB family protein [Stellaceae bacterium]